MGRVVPDEPELVEMLLVARTVEGSRELLKRFLERYHLPGAGGCLNLTGPHTELTLDAVCARDQGRVLDTALGVVKIRVMTVAGVLFVDNLRAVLDDNTGPSREWLRLLDGAFELMHPGKVPAPTPEDTP